MTRDLAPLVGILGTPAWAASARRTLAAHGYRVVVYVADAHLLPRLIEDHPVALLVDATRPEWPEPIIAIKTEQATRRLPVLVIGATPAGETTAHQVGVEALLASRDLDEALIEQVRAHARVLDEATQHTLACQCREPLPPLGRSGIRRFNAGAYYAQHDAFEALWMAESGPVRELYRAILQVGVAYYHITRGNYTGGLKMLWRSVQWLAMLPDVCQGVDVRQLREDAARVRHALERREVGREGAFDMTLLRPVRWSEAAGTGTRHDPPENRDDQ